MGLRVTPRKIASESWRQFRGMLKGWSLAASESKWVEHEWRTVVGRIETIFLRYQHSLCSPAVPKLRRLRGRGERWRSVAWVEAMVPSWNRQIRCKCDEESPFSSLRDPKGEVRVLVKVQPTSVMTFGPPPADCSSSGQGQHDLRRRSPCQSLRPCHEPTYSAPSNTGERRQQSHPPAAIAPRGAPVTLT